ncbi:MAG: hypothetical protein R2873_21845 [Caldilineaceae bacterium]
MQLEQPSTDTFRILVVSLSEIWARSARAILATLADVDVLQTARGGLTAYEIVRSEHPDLMVIDDSLPSDEAQRLLELLSEAPHRPYCIAMIPSSRHKWFMQRAGADATVLRSNASNDLISAVLLAREHIKAGQ